MKLQALGFASLLAACGPSIKVPQVATGDVPFRVINDTDYQYCEFEMAEPHNHGLGPSWIGNGRSLNAHSSADLKVHPGVYQIFAEACDRAAESFIRRIRIDGPTEVSLGGLRGGAPGVKHVALEVEILKHYGPAEPYNGGGGGEAEPADEAAGESNESTAAAPAEAPCAGPGVEVSGINDCCSHRDRTVGSSHNGGHYVCCAETGPCEGTP